MSEHRPYEALAPCYAQLMEHVEYSRWARYILRIFKVFSHEPRRFFELAGGDLSFASQLKLSPDCLRVHSDLSFEMLQQSEIFDKFVVDMRHVPFADQSFDSLICLYDSVNYLLSDLDVQQFLDEVQRLLSPGGLAVFDAVSPYTCMRYFGDYKDWIQINSDDLLLRHAYFDDETGCQHNLFRRFQLRDGSAHTQEEHHVQQLRDLDEWLAWIDSTPGLELLGAYANYTLNPAKEKSERWHFVVRKV